MALRILIVDDHDVVRAGLRSILERQTDIEVVGEAPDGRQGLELVRKLGPNVVLMDLSMPELNGLEATRQVKAQDANTKVIVLSMHADRHYVSEVLKAGASGYLLKNAAARELVDAVRAAAAGRVYLSPQIAEVVVEDYRRLIPESQSNAFRDLSSREREVLQLLAEGKQTKEIAAALHLSPKTVESHRGQIMAKLNLHSVAELTKFAIREGLTPLE
jgi:DNA-binding NarL/FixJ family response regulator